MSDLLAPLLAVLDHEADAFWCFVGYMELMVCVLDQDQCPFLVEFGCPMLRYT
jgi:hypothetical protein